MEIVRQFRVNDITYCEGYERFADRKGFYLFRLKVNHSFNRVIDEPVLQNGIEGDFVKATINDLDRKVVLQRFRAIFRDTPFDKNKHSEETFIRFLGPSFHPIIALAYELQDDLRVDIITNLAINLLEKEINNDRNLIVYICEYLWELVNSNYHFEYTEYYNSVIIQEYAQAQTLNMIMAFEEFNLEVYEQYPPQFRYPNKKVHNKLWAMNYLSANKRDGVLRETHNGPHDYHIHYLVKVKDEPKRTNKLLTFDREKETNELYWENHNEGGINVELPKPERKRKKIYEKCYNCLVKIKKEHFRKPSKEEAIIYYP
ncbi:hypothetical protein [Bacillus cereus]|uniref:hypothetical protein n=1 Tax=Bacillus cereus group sp. MYBKT111-2 TaxID=3450598 RepID=UPI000BF6AA29|nr:hypothetical protein [Bacillus cereus group sp. TH260-2LC]PEU04105.1 hypothetical protein CN527_04535 [Bacillus cereus]PGN92700.1 hypothetical protein CN976_23240 [Bacillus cereus]